MAGTKELKEAIGAAFAITREGIAVKKNGIAAESVNVMGLFGKVTAAWDGKDLIDDEAMDLDAAEIEDLSKFVAQELAMTLVAAGMDPNSKAGRSLAVLPRALALAQHTYVEGKAIADIVNGTTPPPTV